MLTTAFPRLEPVDLPVVVRLRDRESHDVLIDVMKPVQQPYTDALKHTHKVQIERETVRIPTLEMAVVMKFSAMISLYRANLDKHQDAHDFMAMVLNHAELDEVKLAELAELIYPDGGKDVVEMVRQVRAGEQLVL